MSIVFLRRLRMLCDGLPIAAQLAQDLAEAEAASQVHPGKSMHRAVDPIHLSAQEATIVKPWRNAQRVSSEALV
ncbi:MAG: hypothetical protein KF722_09425 [Nitrospira sp.]|nr:hypothetical protein [Nitrospira sp.]